MTFRQVRLLAATMGAAILAWQVGNAFGGKFIHRFLVADLIAAGGLVGACCVRDRRVAAVGMLVGFAGLGGVLLAASTGALLVDGFDLGRAMAALGVVPCAVGAASLARRLTGPGTGV